VARDPRPDLGLGVGWRPELALTIDRRPDVGFVEILAENVDPRKPLPAALRRLRERGVRIVVHSIGLSLGGAEAVDPRRLDRLARVAEWAGAVCVSDHVAFVRAGGRGTGHLLPVPRTEATLAVLCENVDRARRALPVPLALENIATLFDWPDPDFDEPELLTRLTEATGAFLLLDVANLYANARNFGFDSGAWLERAPLGRIAYVHVGGGVARNGLWHDTHAHAVPAEALALLSLLRARGPLPGVLLERDDRFPPAAEINRELDDLARAATFDATAAPLPAAALPPGARRAPASATDRRDLGARQERLVGALVGGEPAPEGFDARLVEAEAAMLAAKRLRAAGRAWPRLDLEGAHRDRFLAWARANPLDDDDACGCDDGRRFLAHIG
jgi:uncharacterized protein (UPF0276 family)